MPASGTGSLFTPRSTAPNVNYGASTDLGLGDEKESAPKSEHKESSLSGLFTPRSTAPNFSYGISEDLYGYRPATFIGTPDGGLYLLGEQMLPYVQKYIDLYLEGGDLEAVQEEINEQRLEAIEEFYNQEEYSD